jgi:RNA polymerase sigma factor (sigma-70 family)
MTPLDEWFAVEILPHEAALMRYLTRAWRNQSEITDVRQEVYARVFQSALKRLPECPKSFLFATARNLLTDRVRRERVVSIDYTQEVESLNVLVDEISPERRLSARQELRRLSEALDKLSDNCRSVIWLRRVEGLSQREAAERLDMNVGAVEGYLSRGMRTLAKAVFGNDLTGDEQANAEEPNSQGRPGKSIV